MNLLELDELSDKILLKIRSRPGHKWSISRLASFLKSDLNDIFDGLARLRECGYKLRIKERKTIAFIKSPDLLLPAEIKFGLKSKRFGRKIHAFKSVKSTNTNAIKLAHEGAAEGELVVAEMQTKGRGRMGHDWLSSDKVGIYMSLIVKPKMSGKDISPLALVAAHSVVYSINKLYKLDCKIKWPNDILVKDKKIAGILVESSLIGKNVEHAVIGIGINVNHTKSDLGDEMFDRATSLRILLRRKQSRVELIQKILYYLERDYLKFQKDGFAAIRKKILPLSRLIGLKIKLKTGNKIIVGDVIDIDKDGYIVIRDGDNIAKFNAGEVTTQINRER